MQDGGFCYRRRAHPAAGTNFIFYGYSSQGAPHPSRLCRDVLFQKGGKVKGEMPFITTLSRFLWARKPTSCPFGKNETACAVDEVRGPTRRINRVSCGESIRRGTIFSKNAKTPLTTFALCAIITPVHKTLPNCVKVARQTLTLFVRVRILLRQPKRKSCRKMGFFYFIHVPEADILPNVLSTWQSFRAQTA